MLKLILLLPLALLFTSCAHHKDVRPGVSGEHNVMVRAEDTHKGSRDALSQANHYCKQYGKSAAIIKESSKYSGNMDEQTYKNTKTASKVAQAVGSTAHVFGGKRESNLGGIAVLGGTAANAAAGNGYTVEMKFKCL